jgi:hypothetical protein
MSHFKITHESKFINGVNYQLHYGFDFGEHRSIPHLGLHHKPRLELVGNDFAQLAAHGVRSVRMNVFADGRTGIIYSGTGNALGIQDSVIEGVLDLLRVAGEHDILVSLVMLDHKLAERAEWIDGTKPELGAKQGHGRLLLTRSGRDEMMNNIFRPLLQGLGKSKPQNLLSFELVNEPELLVQGLSTVRSMQTLLPRADIPHIKAYMRVFCDLARSETQAQFTVGSLALKHAGIWLDVLDPEHDYLSIHYYGQNGEPAYRDLYREDGPGDPLKTVKGLQRRIPLVWGEYAANGFSDFSQRDFPQDFASAAQFLEDALNNQVKGAYAWAFRSPLGALGDLFGPVPLEQHREFAQTHLLTPLASLPRLEGEGPGVRVS